MQFARVKVFPDSGSKRSLTGRALIGISLGNRTTSSPGMLREVFNWTRENVGGFDLLVGDFLDRHNRQAFLGESEEEAAKKAVLAGMRLAERLRELISDGYPKSTEVISAVSLYGASSFAERLAHFERVYEKNDQFRTLIGQAVSTFLARKHLNVTSDVLVLRHCIAYQLEELVMFEQLAEIGYTALVYAGAQLPVMKSIVSKSLHGVSPTLESLTLFELRRIATQ